MKKNKRIITLIIISILVIGILSLGLIFFLDKNRLTIEEKNWIDDSIASSTLININVLNDAYVFGNNGEGVYYTFLNKFNEKYALNINKVTYSHTSEVSGVTLGLKKSISDNDLIIYEDHYVLVNKDHEIINDYQDLSNKTIVVLSSDLDFIKSYINNDKIVFETTESIEDLFGKVSNGQNAIVPLHLYLRNILLGKYNINYHFSDIKNYYTLSTTNDYFSKVLKKYYNTWSKDFKNIYNEELFKVLVEGLSLNSSDIQQMQGTTYNYGFVNNSPYEVISGGKYGGIVAMYLNDFTSLAGVDIKFTRYNNYKKFENAINSGKIDLYFSTYNINNNFKNTINGLNARYVVVANNKNNMAIDSLASLVGKEVYVDANSLLYKYISAFGNIKIKPYTKTRELARLNRKDVIIMIDANSFDYYQTNILDNYSIRYEEALNDNYHFSVAKDNCLYELLNAYINVVDNHQMINEGKFDHVKTVRIGNLFSTIAKYFISIVAIVIIVGYIYIKKTKKIKIAKKIKKDDTIRFIDQLTMLKNRNYLSENIKEWSKNTIYPQTIIVVDLNKLQLINDTKGYEEGDKQIKAAANALIKTQLDNSDIIRTDGNEFVIYMVGYNQKQITNYIHKLNKEFKKLPYEYGAEYGYSIILDDIKTIEDALNEATKALKKQKGSANENKD